MARPQAADYDARRRAILNAAANLYARSGFHGCSIADLAKACGMSKSLLYHYFSSKEDILYEIMQAHVMDLQAALDSAADITHPRARFEAVLQRFMTLYEDAAAYHKVLVGDLDKLPSDRRTEIVATERKIISELSDLIAQLAPDLAATPDKLRATTMLFFGMINWTHTWFKPDGNLSSEQLADLVLNLFLGGAQKV